MTPLQKKQFNHMLWTLQAINKGYQTPEQLKRNSQKEYGLDYEEALEYAYENVKQMAKTASFKVREIK